MKDREAVCLKGVRPVRLDLTTKRVEGDSRDPENKKPAQGGKKYQG
jgi:hypothetical protein